MEICEVHDKEYKIYFLRELRNTERQFNAIKKIVHEQNKFNKETEI